MRQLCEIDLPGIARRPGVAGVHLLVADESASGLKTEEQRARLQDNAIPRYVMLLESWGDETAFPGMCAKAVPDDLLLRSGAQDIDKGTYRLQNTRLKTAWSP